MKHLPRRTPLAEEATHQEDITPQFEAGTEPRAYRRTTVTVERETLSVFTRRSSVDPVATTVACPAGEESTSELPDPSPPQTTAEMRPAPLPYPHKPE